MCCFGEERDGTEDCPPTTHAPCSPENAKLLIGQNKNFHLLECKTIDRSKKTLSPARI